MKSFTLVFLLSWFMNPPIIIRHDKSDADFIALAKRFEKNICHLNLPDCEGTVIDKNWILSAAHCAIEIQNKFKKEETHKVVIDGQYFEVDRVIIHENWQSNEAHDIALLHIKEPATTSEPVEIYKGNKEAGQLVYIVGKGDYGDGIQGVQQNDGKLRAATNRVDEATDFWLKWKFDSPDGQPTNATEFEGVSGPGDSGGPAFIIENGITYIVGISSGQSTRNTNGKEGVYGVIEYYTRVSRYVDWIDKNMK